VPKKEKGKKTKKRRKKVPAHTAGTKLDPKTWVKKS